MKIQDIYKHIQSNVPHGAELVTILMNDPSEWAGFDSFLKEKLNFDEFAILVSFLRIRNKTITSETGSKSFITYSEAFKVVGRDDLAESMSKIEFMVKLSYEKNYKFLQDEIAPYLRELYQANKTKFELRLKNNEIIEDPEYKMMLMIQDKLDFISEKIKTILNKKPVINTVKFRKSKDVLILIEALTS